MNAELSKQLSRIHIATVLIIILATVGAIAVLTGALDWDSYFKDMTVGTGLLAIGRGISPHTGA